MTNTAFAAATSAALGAFPAFLSLASSRVRPEAWCAVARDGKATNAVMLRRARVSVVGIGMGCKCSPQMLDRDSAGSETFSGRWRRVRTLVSGRPPSSMTDK